jgi:hypothetical protein
VLDAPPIFGSRVQTPQACLEAGPDEAAPHPGSGQDAEIVETIEDPFFHRAKMEENQWRLLKRVYAMLYRLSCVKCERGDRQCASAVPFYVRAPGPIDSFRDGASDGCGSGYKDPASLESLPGPVRTPLPGAG